MSQGHADKSRAELLEQIQELEKRLRKAERSINSTRLNARISEDIAEAGKTLLMKAQEALEEENRLRSQKEAELLEATRLAELGSVAKSRFLAMMSHEMRTPMHGVLGLLELLLSSPLSSAQRDLALLAHSSAKALVELVSGVLDYSTIEAKKLELIEEPFRLREFVDELVALEGGASRDRDIAMVGVVDPELPDGFIGDAGRLRQVLLNLLGNAVKYTPQGCVSLRVSAVNSPKELDSSGEEMWLRLTVSDTGIGIAASDIDRLFEPFSQLDNTPARRYEGSGLGLAITASLLELLGGEIEVESEVGVGSKFHVLVPFALDPDWSAEPVEPVLQGEVVLVADRQPEVVEQLQLLLEPLGAAVVTAGSLGECEAQLERHREGLDLILMERALFLGLSSRPKSVEIVLLTDLSTGPESGSPFAPLHQTLLKPIRSRRLLEVVQPMELGAEPSGPQGVVLSSELIKEIRASRDEGTARVLVVDDNESNLVVAGKMLEHLGCAVDTVRGGRDALDAIKRIDYRLILMDCSMPDIDGYETTRRVRASQEDVRPRPAIVGMTAFALPGEEERCVAAGMDFYLPKPVGLDAMQGLIERYLGPRQESR